MHIKYCKDKNNTIKDIPTFRNDSSNLLCK